MASLLFSVVLLRVERTSIDAIIMEVVFAVYSSKSPPQENVSAFSVVLPLRQASPDDFISCVAFTA
jgi:hypothetical protein